MDFDSRSPVVVLAGGTGGAKLARGMLDVAGDDLVVIANTGDDIEIYGAHVSPDPDLCTFWLADRIDPRGWGLDGDTFHVMDGLRELGVEVWFNLGDRDLAYGIRRARAAGRRRAADRGAGRARAARSASRRPRAADGRRAGAHRVRRGERWVPFQEFMVRERAAPGPIDDVRYDGAADAAAPPEALDADRRGAGHRVGPSNPMISIGPILAVPGIAEALRAAPRPSSPSRPSWAARSLKGPTADSWRGPASR